MSARLIVAALMLCCLTTGEGATAVRDEVVGETSTDEVDITLRFHGKDVLVFGAIPARSRVVVKVTAPAERVVLARKQRVGPFWMTADTAEVSRLPAVFQLYPQAPLSELFPHGVPPELDYRTLAASASVVPHGEGAYAEGYVGLKEKVGLYGVFEGRVASKRGKVFKLTVPVSDHVPPGELRVEIFAVRGGRIVSRDTDLIHIEKVGIERWLSELAVRHPAAYGLLAVGVALGAGLGVGFLFRQEGGGD